MFGVSDMIAHGTAYTFKHRGHLFCRRHLNSGATQLFILNFLKVSVLGIISAV